MIPRPGDVVYIGPACGVPYTIRPILLRVIEVVDHQPHAPGAWLAGYEIRENGRAVARRDIYVGILAGLRPARVAVAVPTPRNGGPQIPRQRTRPTVTTTSGRTR